MSLINLTVVKVNHGPLFGTAKVIPTEANAIEFVVEDMDVANIGGSLIFIESKAGSRALVLQCEETLSEIKALANADMVILLDVTIKEAEGFINYDLTGGSNPALVNARKISTLQDITEVVVPIQYPSARALLKMESIIGVTDGGSLYEIADVLTASGGTGTNATFTVTRVKPINAQTQANYGNSPTTEGSFTPGTGYANGNTITLSDGTIVTVVTQTAGAVATFTVNSAPSAGTVTNNASLTQSSTTGSGTGFELILDGDNQAVHTVTLTTAGQYSVLPTSITAVAVTGGLGTGATISVDFEVDSVVVDAGGTGLVTVTVSITGGGGTGATATGTVTAGALASVTVTAPGNNFTSLPVVSITSTGPTRTKVEYIRTNKQRPTVLQVTESRATLIAAANATTDVNVLTSYTIYGVDRPFTSDYSKTSTIVLNDLFVQRVMTNTGTGTSKLYYNHLGLENGPRFRKYYID